MEGNKRFEITGNGLKLIAMITMLIDHLAYGLYQKAATAHDWAAPYSWDFYSAMRIVGRMAFPLYCFLLVEGFFHTRDFRKYGIRLLILATISEFPFDFAVNFRNSYFEYNNVIFTLLIGLLTIGTIDYIRRGNVKWLDQGWKATLGLICVFLLGCIMAYVMHTDYDYTGVSAIVAMYYLYGTDRPHRVLAFTAGVMVLFIGSSSTEAAALLMLLPIAFYDGNRGSSSPVIRHTFNLFYPIHLLVIGLIGYLFL